MRTLLKTSAATIALSMVCLLAAPAMAYTTSALEGRLVNHSDYSFDRFEISVDLKCQKQGIIFPRDCGRASATVTPDTSGKFTIPALKVGGGLLAEHSMYMTIRLKGLKGDYSLSSANWSLVHGIDEKLQNFRTITVLGLKERDLIFNLASGRDGAEWSRTDGRDSLVRYEFDFSNGKAEPLSPLRIRTLQSGLFMGDTAQFAERVLIVPAASEVSPRVIVKRQLDNSVLSTKALEESTMTVDLSQPLPAAFYTFDIDDRGHAPTLRTLDGRWKLTLQFTSYTSLSENNLFDAEMNVRCVAGKIQGSMTVAPRGASTQRFNGTVAVEGECAEGSTGEEGTLRFNMPAFSDGALESWSAKFVRINARMLLSTERDAVDSHDADTYVMRLKIRNSKGELFGSIYTERL